MFLVLLKLGIIIVGFFKIPGRSAVPPAPAVVAVRVGPILASVIRLCRIAELLDYWRVISITPFQTLSKSHLVDFFLALVCVVQPHLALSALPPAADRCVVLRFSLRVFEARFAHSLK